VVALCALALVAVGAAGCGEEDGVADGATVTAYVEQPLCEDEGNYKRDSELIDIGSFDLRIICLPDPRNPRGGELSQGVGGPQRIDLATVGANARRATEDSTAVAYAQRDDPVISRFTEPILDAAGIGLVTANEGDFAASRLIGILEEADPSSLRADVRDALGQS
jgi:hypothetical protein